MFKRVQRWGFGAIPVVAIALGSATIRAQDPVKIAPNNYKVAFDNDTVRVCEIAAKAGDKIASHSHPDHAVYAITAGKIKFTYADGKTKEVEMKAGDATWIKAETHATENIGTGEFKAVVVELKKPAGSASKIPAEEDQAKSSPENTKVVLDNDRVRLLDVRLKAGGKLAKHSHPASVHYSFTGGKLKVTTFPHGKSEDKTFTAGQAKWSDPVTHAVENVGTTEMHGLLIELKEQAKSAETKPSK